MKGETAAGSRFCNFTIIVIFVMLLSGCVIIDGGSVKSQLEIDYNNMFGTDFDFIGHVEVLDTVSEEVVYRASAEDFYDYLQGSNLIESRDLREDYIIKLMAVDDQQYAKRQKEAILLFDRSKGIICYKIRCLEVTENFSDLADTW